MDSGTDMSTGSIAVYGHHAEARGFPGSDVPGNSRGQVFTVGVGRLGWWSV